MTGSVIRAPIRKKYNVGETGRDGDSRDTSCVCVRHVTCAGHPASLFLLNEAVEDEMWKRLEEKILPILEDRQGRVLGGVSEPAVRGRVVKLLAKSAPDLNATFKSIWAAARALLWGLPFPALRRY